MADSAYVPIDLSVVRDQEAFDISTPYFRIVRATGPMTIRFSQGSAEGEFIPTGSRRVFENRTGEPFGRVYISNEIGAGEVIIMTSNDVCVDDPSPATESRRIVPILWPNARDNGNSNDFFPDYAVGDTTLNKVATGSGGSTNWNARSQIGNITTFRARDNKSTPASSYSNRNTEGKLEIGHVFSLLNSAAGSPTFPNLGGETQLLVFDDVILAEAQYDAAEWAGVFAGFMRDALGIGTFAAGEIALTHMGFLATGTAGLGNIHVVVADEVNGYLVNFDTGVAVAGVNRVQIKVGWLQGSPFCGFYINGELVYQLAIPVVNLDLSGGTNDGIYLIETTLADGTNVDIRFDMSLFPTVPLLYWEMS